MYTETHHLLFSKGMQRARTGSIEGQMASMFSSVITRSLQVRGWSVKLDDTLARAWDMLPSDNPDYEYIAEAYAVITFTREDGKKPEVNELASLLATLHNRASQPAFGKWALTRVNDTDYHPPTDDEVISARIDKEHIGYTELVLPEDWTVNFEHLYGLEPHIELIRKAINAGIRSGWMHRFHCALIGKPGCGKSDICRSLRAAFGDEAVWELDATATTAAGAIKELSEMEILPRIVVVEEIEKGDEKMTQFLLSILDLRGEIRKTTHRTNIQRDTKLLCVATVNDEDTFEKMNKGALASRFPNKIHFKRPSRATRALILAREIEKIDGDMAWIDPTLDYCEDHGIDDPRRIISIALCGGDDLLDQSYQAMLRETAATTEGEN